MLLMWWMVVQVNDRDEERQMAADSPDPAQHRRGLQTSGTSPILVSIGDMVDIEDLCFLLRCRAVALLIADTRTFKHHSFEGDTGSRRVPELYGSNENTRKSANENHQPRWFIGRVVHVCRCVFTRSRVACEGGYGGIFNLSDRKM